jgi:hypothetical protein
MAYEIDEFGIIHRTEDDMPEIKKTEAEKIYEEYNKLVYDLSHPERFSAEEYEQKKRRRTEIENSGADLGNKNAVNYKMAELKLKLKEKSKTQNNLSGSVKDRR